MKANEFRIGNYFYPSMNIEGTEIPATGIVYKVGMIDKFGIVSVIEPENYTTLI